MLQAFPRDILLQQGYTAEQRHHRQESKCSDVWAHERHFSFKPLGTTECYLLKLWAQVNSSSLKLLFEGHFVAVTRKVANAHSNLLRMDTFAAWGLSPVREHCISWDPSLALLTLLFAAFSMDLQHGFNSHHVALMLSMVIHLRALYPACTWASPPGIFQVGFSTSLQLVTLDGTLARPLSAYPPI